MYSEYYESKKLNATYGGKEYEICYLAVGDDTDYKILLNEDIDGSIGTCELEMPASTWYTELKEATDGNFYRVGNPSATTENLKLYPLVLFGPTGTSDRSQYWRKGKNSYAPGSNIPSYLFNAKINTFCIRISGTVTDARTGITHHITTNDLLNPDENLYISSMDTETGYLLDYNTNEFSTTLRGIRAGALMSGNTIGGVIDFRELCVNNYSNTYLLSTGNSTSEGGGYNILKDLDSKTKVTPLLNTLPVSYSEDTYTFNGPWYISSSFTTTTQTINFNISLKFYVKILQSLGCYVTVDSLGTSLTFNEDFLKNKSNVLLGELNENGYPTFNWLTAEDRVTSVSPNLDTNYTTGDITYNPTHEGDDDNITPIKTRSFGELTGFIKYYEVTNLELDNFINSCQEAGDVKPGFEYMPYVVSVTQFPFNVKNYVGTEDHKSIIKINGVTLDGSYRTPDGTVAKGYKLNKNVLPINNIGTTTIHRKFNNFLDYAPYTNIEIFIPCCGYINLPSECMGHDIQVVLIMDIINASCKGVVYCQGIPVAEKQGIIGRSIAVTGTENGLKTQSTIASATGVVSSAVGIATGVVTGNGIAVASGGLTAINSITQAIAQSNNSYTRTCGKNGDMTNFHDSNTCYIKITRPVTDLPDNYGNTVGYVTNETKTLSTCKGFIKVFNANTNNIKADYQHKAEIKALLETGVYIK